MTLTTIFDHGVILFGAGAFIAAALAVLAASTWIIRENESGLVIKLYGPPLGAGRLVAVDREAGYQARRLTGRDDPGRDTAVVLDRDVRA